MPSEGVQPAIETEARSEGLPARPRLRQAVVIVHGMGEQKPMETIRSFAKAVWSLDLDLTEGVGWARKPDPDNPGEEINKSWIRPDTRARSYELRRITTPYDRHGRRTDFFELYWADITQGTTLGRLRGWWAGLLLRRWSDVPRNVRKLYLVAWILTVLIVLPTIVLAAMKWFGLSDVIWPAGVWTIAAALATAFVTLFLIPYFGDVASYVEARPDTVRKREQARERGRALLRTLMLDDGYDRIVLVAHSLGTILAYDLLQILWTEFAPGPANPRQDPEEIGAFEAVGAWALPMDSAERAKIRMDDRELAEFRTLQWKTYKVLREPVDRLRSWKISDFVTFGSPLTHAEFLIARNAAELAKAVDERLLATCPPVSERARPTVLYRLPDGARYPHHGAVFAATRWTNVFDKGNGWLTGDPISGSMLENFGPGVENIQVKLRWGLGRTFTHTHYWSLDATGSEVLPSGKPGTRTHLDVLRDAVDLGRTLEQ